MSHPTGLTIRAGIAVHGSVYAGASRLQDRDYLRRLERLNAERAAKATPAPDESRETRPSTPSSRRAKRP
jgi:hypothetical protein